MLLFLRYTTVQTYSLVLVLNMHFVPLLLKNYRTPKCTVFYSWKVPSIVILGGVDCFDRMLHVYWSPAVLAQTEEEVFISVSLRSTPGRDEHHRRGKERETR